jgi:hypothetical protein
MKVGFFLGGQYWGLNSGLHCCYADTLPIVPLYQPCFVLDFFGTVSQELFAQADFKP